MRFRLQLAGSLLGIGLGAVLAGPSMAQHGHVAHFAPQQHTPPKSQNRPPQHQAPPPKNAARPPQNRQKILENNNKYRNLPPAQKEELNRRAEQWSRLSPQQQSHIRNDVLP